MAVLRFFELVAACRETVGKEMALDRGKVIVPHRWKTGIGIAATAHVAVAALNCRFIESLPAELT